MQSAPPPPTTPLLWERLRALFGRIISAIGAPALIAALTLAPRLRTGIVRQLALVEILARKLLLAEAAALAPSLQRGPRLIEAALASSGLYLVRETRSGHIPSPARAIDLAHPESWPARFALAIPRGPRAVQDHNAPRIRSLWGYSRTPPPTRAPMPRQRNSDAFRVARRAEALRRMLHNPAPYVMRLARARRIGVARSRDAIKRYALKTPRCLLGDRYDPRLSVDIYSAAIRAHGILTDTS